MEKINLFESYFDEEDINMINKTLRRSTYWSNGPEIEEFEKKIADYLNRKYAVAFNSGTSALHANFLANGIIDGEVIVPALTFPATVNSVVLSGAKPVFADIENETLGLDANDVEKKITSKTKAVIVVNFAGAVARDIIKLREIADKKNILLIEDNAQSLGASLGGKKAGSFGNSAILSFCFNKILTTGEGGMVMADDGEVANKLRLLRAHGRDNKKDYIMAGFNMRIPTSLAALGISQFNKLDFMIDMRRRMAKNYDEKFSDLDFVKPMRYNGNNKSVYCTYNLLFENEKIRNLCKEFLKYKGIPTRISYPPVHLYSFYRKNYGSREGDLPVTEYISKKILSIPFHLNLGENEQKYIGEIIKQFSSLI